MYIFRGWNSKKFCAKYTYLNRLKSQDDYAFWQYIWLNNERLNSENMNDFQKAKCYCWSSGDLGCGQFLSLKQIRQSEDVNQSVAPCIMIKTNKNINCIFLIYMQQSNQKFTGGGGYNKSCISNTGLRCRKLPRWRANGFRPFALHTTSTMHANVVRSNLAIYFIEKNDCRCMKKCIGVRCVLA